MQRILVEETRWVSPRRFLHALNVCMLLPGPEAQQLATYVGWLLHGWRGGLVAGGLFVLPGFLAILALSILYVGTRGVPLVEGLFFGLTAAVLAVVVEALARIGRRALRSGPARAMAAASFVAIFVFAVPFPAIVAAAALLGALGDRLRPGSFAPRADEEEDGDDLRPAGVRRPLLRLAGVVLLWGAIWAVPFALVAAFLGTDHVLFREAAFFSRTALVTFGGAYAVLAYVAQQAVEAHGWLTAGEMLHGLGLAETTPGPLIMVVEFVGFLGAYREPGALDPLVAGILGAAVTTWVTFAPCFLLIFAVAPAVEWLRARRGLAAALAGITAAVVGVILNLAVWFALHTLFGTVVERRIGPTRLLAPDPATLDVAALALAAAAFGLLFGLRWGMLRTLAAIAAAGAVVRLAGGG